MSIAWSKHIYSYISNLNLKQIYNIRQGFFGYELGFMITKKNQNMFSWNEMSINLILDLQYVLV